MSANDDYCYYYLHTNGNLIYKTVWTCEYNTTPEEYFASDFVVKYWKVNTKEIKDMLKMYKEVQQLRNKLEGKE